MAESVSPLISVVVPTRNRVLLLRVLLSALTHQEGPAFEVIVIDDASNDDTPRVLAEWAGKDRLALRLETPSGSYAARNVGWRRARGRIVAFTDDDCIPQPGWLADLVSAFSATTAVAVQGTTVAYPGRVTPFTHQIQQTHGGPPYRTCNIAYRRDSLEILGGFDDTLPWYADNLLGLRACRIGKIVFASEAVVYHPPRLREWRTRWDWRARFDADARYRRELHRIGAESVTVPGTILPVVLWVFRPLVKQSWRHMAYFVRNPATYLGEIGPMAREKWELVVALRERASGLGQVAKRNGLRTHRLSPRPLVSIVIVTKDRASLLDAALAAIDVQTWPLREVIVVDHGGHESARAVAAMHGAEYTPAPKSTLAAARQVGVDRATGEIVAFTDDDCMPDTRWLTEIVSAFRNEPGLLGVQGRTVAESGAIGAHVVRVEKPNSLFQTCNMAYRRDALIAAGGFDRDFVGWFEDTALGARVLKYGPIGFAERAVVIHRSMPRRPLDRATWRTLLADERLLSTRYPTFYRKTRGPGFHATVIGRWLLGSPLRTMIGELPRARDNPSSFLSLAGLLMQERWELVRALIAMERA